MALLCLKADFLIVNPIIQKFKNKQPNKKTFHHNLPDATDASSDRTNTI
jgi:hypothetical protein